MPIVLLPLLAMLVQADDRVLAPFRAVPRYGEALPPAPLAGPTLQAQVRGMVDRDFARFDRDGDARLDRVEFARWMAALSIHGEGSATRSWIEAAFAEADANASGGVDRAEVTGFIGRAAGWRLPPRAVRSAPARGG